MFVRERTKWSGIQISKEDIEGWILEAAKDKSDLSWVEQVSRIFSGNTLVVRINEEIFVCEVKEIIPAPIYKK